MSKSDDDASAASNGPLLLTGPVIDLEPLTASTAEPEAASSEEAPPQPSRWKLTGPIPLAAGIALAMGVGLIAGAAGTAGLLHDGSSENLAAIQENRALHDSVAQLGSELATLKSGIVSAQRSASTQYGKLAERLDRAEKAQAEPTAKLAKIQESLDRLDRRQQQAALTPAPAAAPTSAASPEITGSITASKEESRPPVAEGWRLRDFYAGRALVQARNGTLFEVAPGSKLPGLGRVESVKQDHGQVVVVAQNGTIAGSVAQRRPGFVPPYRY
jgi:hypothetical protein